MSNTEHEVWKQYPEFDFIEVSNLGNVRTKDRIVTDRNGKKYHIKGRVLKQRLDKDGYLVVHIRENGKSFFRKVHRMVLVTFCPNPGNLPEVNHIDCDRTNNRLDNLEWCDSQYNIAYREKYGVACNCPVIAVNPETLEVLYFDSQSEAARQLGASQGNISDVLKGKMNTVGGYLLFEDESEITEEKIREVKAKMEFRGGVIAVNPENSEVFWFKSQSEAARQLNISVQRVNVIVKGKQSKTGGWWFCHVDENTVEKVRAKFGDDIASKVEKLMNEHRN